jgi:hypothetical protein
MSIDPLQLIFFFATVVTLTETEANPIPLALPHLERVEDFLTT